MYTKFQELSKKKSMRIMNEIEHFELESRIYEELSTSACIGIKLYHMDVTFQDPK